MACIAQYGSVTSASRNGGMAKIAGGRQWHGGGNGVINGEENGAIIK
jgi:hypothetical protein